MLELALVFGVLGAIVGSFLNVLILRRGVKTILGRSGCLSCGHELEAVDLVPIFSWLALRGRCRFCGSKISIQYPLVEGATAVLFGFLGAAALGPLAGIVSAQAIILFIDYLAIAALLVAIAAYDLKHTIIPDLWAYALALLALLSQFLVPQSGLPILYILLAGPASALPFAALWLVSRGRWMGLGDAKLALGVGWLLGPVYGLFAVMFAFVLGAAVSVFILLPLSSPGFWKFLGRFTPISRSPNAPWGFTMKSEVAFGPFLAVACVIVWLLLLNGHDPFALFGQGLL